MKKTNKSRFFALCLSITLLICLVSINVFATGEKQKTDLKIWDGTIADGFAGGTGVENDPYVIETAEQLAFLANSVNGDGETQKSGKTYSGKYIKLINDISLNNTDNLDTWGNMAPSNKWNPIGTYYSAEFSGTFDGDGHTVSGIYINNENSSQGLFGYISTNAVVKNVVVEKSYIKAGSNVGGIVGYADYSCSIENCINTSEVIGGNAVGGIVGYNYNNCNVVGCCNKGNVTGNGHDSVGGIVGYNYNGSKVDNCNNTGTVSGIAYVGGIVGDNSASNSNKISEVKNSNNTGTVSGTTQVGGVVGYNKYKCKVSYCKNSGIVIGSGENIGGIVGEVNNTGTSYYIIEYCNNEGEISGNDNIGGIVGKNNMNKVRYCFNNGKVIGRDSVGGIAGVNDAMTSTVDNCYNKGEISGGSYIGGVVGKNSGTLNYCYNIGNVSGKNYVGGVAGVNFASISYCYYLKGRATDETGTSQYGIGTLDKGKTTEDISGKTQGLDDTQMKTKSSFQGWDFKDVWLIDQNENNGYPSFVCKHTSLVTVKAKASTCYEKGWEEYKECSQCHKAFNIDGKTELQGIPYRNLAEHNYGLLIPEKSASHSSDGEKEHYHCSVCGKNFDSSKNELSSITIQKDENHGKPADEWKTDEKCHWHECKVADCNVVIESTKAQHTFEWKIDTAATEDSTGIKHEECSVCGMKRNENTVISKLDHTHTIVHHNAVPGSCKAEGNIEYWTCSNSKCTGKYFSEKTCTVEIENITVPMNENNHIHTEIKNNKGATCSEDGFSGDIYCKECGKKIEDGKIIKAIGHSYENGKCKTCGKTDSNYVAPTSPQTGVKNNIAVWGSLAFISMFFIVVIFCKKRKTTINE